MGNPSRTLSSVIRNDKTWDRTALEILLPAQLVQKICKIRLPIRDTKHKRIWKESTDGKFKVKNAYPKPITQNNNVHNNDWIRKKKYTTQH